MDIYFILPVKIYNCVTCIFAPIVPALATVSSFGLAPVPL